MWQYGHFALKMFLNLVFSADKGRTVLTSCVYSKFSHLSVFLTYAVFHWFMSPPTIIIVDSDKGFYHLIIGSVMYIIASSKKSKAIETKISLECRVKRKQLQQYRIKADSIIMVCCFTKVKCIQFNWEQI